MLYNTMIAIGGVVVLFGGWVAVQALVRRNSSDLGDEKDVLACNMCGADGSCHCGLRGATSEDPKTGVDL